MITRMVTKINGLQSFQNLSGVLNCTVTKSHELNNKIDLNNAYHDN